MRFRIRHITTYRYENPVALGHHVIRLQPRVDACLKLDDFRLNIHPRPREKLTFQDAEGNLTTTATFEGTTQEFRIGMESSGETFQRFVPVLDARGATYPVNYALEGYDDAALHAWKRTDATGVQVPEFTAGIAREAGPGTLAFLEALSLKMHGSLRDVSRLTGAPLDPEITLSQGKGSCRDFAVLFVACCRLQGIAARFVSGYLPAAAGERQHMHAWAEVLLPGAGWFPYDPTRGVIAGEEHIPVAAAAEPYDAAPLTGAYVGAGGSEMTVEMSVETS